VTRAKDVLTHFGVPETGLVPKVHARLQHLTHGDVRHYSILSFGLCLHAPVEPNPHPAKGYGHPGTPCWCMCVVIPTGTMPAEARFIPHSGDKLNNKNPCSACRHYPGRHLAV